MYDPEERAGLEQQIRTIVRKKPSACTEREGIPHRRMDIFVPMCMRSRPYPKNAKMSWPIEPWQIKFHTLSADFCPRRPEGRMISVTIKTRKVNASLYTLEI